MINSCLNFQNDNKFNLGQILDDFKNFTTQFTPYDKGATLSNSDKIREIHNSFSKNTVFEIDNTMLKTKQEDPFHFVSYLPINGKLIELDGLMSGPVDHGNVDETDWVKTVQKVLENRMKLYGDSEIRFNLMAIVGDRKMKLEEELANATEVETMDEELICKLQQEIENEDAKFERYAKENVLRRHNFIPFIIEHFKILAENNMLTTGFKEAVKN